MASQCDTRLKELEEAITCAVCHGHYQEAKLLPCMHYYCGACIEGLARQSGGRPFLCPECRKDTTLPPGGAEQLQSAFFVERLKDLHRKMAKAAGGTVEAVCEMCSGGKAVAFCRQCTDFICAECVTQHKKQKVFSGHKVTTLDDLKGGARDIPVKEAPPTMCPEHDEPMKIFCFDCNRLICRDCVLYDHREHKSDFVKKCATESRKSLRESLTPLQEVQATIAAADENLVAAEAQVDAQEKEVCQAIQQSFGRLRAFLELREMQLLNRAELLTQEKKDALSAQREDFQSAEMEIQSLLNFVELNVENMSDHELMGIRTQLQAKVEEEDERHQQLSLEPATTADMAYLPPSLESIPSDLGDVFRPSQLLLEMGDMSSTEVGKPSTVTLKAPDHRNPTIRAKLRSLVDPSSSLQADVIRTGVGVYGITFTPRVRGRHDLTVKVNGRVIAGSPFRVFVKIHPTQLGPLVRTVTGVDNPWGIALNSEHQLVVAEWGGKRVTIMEKNGRRVQTIECDKFHGPHGVAIGPDEAMYVTDGGASSLFQLDKTGTLLKTAPTELSLFVKVIKNQIFVSDRANNQVKIFDTDCNAIGTITTNECPGPLDIAEGHDGLYVVGEDKIGVYTCAPNGSFIRHLNIIPSSVKLSQPRGVCFDCSGHLFVTQCGSGAKGVYVFKPSGEHVATFGQASSGVSMRWPAGVVIDGDGFVYVCDKNGHECYVF